MGNNQEHIYLPIEDVSSEHCAMIVHEALNKVDGISENIVELNNKRVKIFIKKENQALIRIAVQTIKDVGYSVPTIQQTFPVLDMTCAGCVNTVESTLNETFGVIAAEVNYATHSVKLTYIPGIIDTAGLKSIVQAAGYDLMIDESSDASDSLEDIKQQKYKRLIRKFIGAMVFSIPLFIIGMFFMNMPYANYIMWALSTPMIFYFGNQFFIGAWKQLKHGSANMDTLVAMSTGTAYIFSVFMTLFPDYFESKGLGGHVYFEAAGIVIAFILLGKVLEEKAKGNTSSAIQKLIGMQPKEVIVINENGEQVITSLNDIQVGNKILVRPGEKIAVDGAVVKGASYVDESMISGEPIAVAKNIGDDVFSGTINQKGSFEFEAEKVGSDTLLAQIIKMVEDAQGSKAPVQKLVDKIASIFVPIVIGIAVLSFILWNILGADHAFMHGFVAFVTVLVIACPCALGLATPTAIMVGIGKGADKGILIKDAESLEMAQKIDTVILDKTGTITEGKPKVNALKVFSSEKQFVTDLLYSIELNSDHPLAQAVVDHIAADAKNLDNVQIENIVGKGVKGWHEEQEYFIGSPKAIQSQNIDFNEEVDSWLAGQLNQGQTVVFLVDADEVLAGVAISDQIKEQSKIAIEKLHRLNIDVYMLTGDNKHSAKSVAEAVNIDHFEAEMLPADKAAFVADLQEKGKVVAMVGDGINDSNALAQSDIGIAMGKGSDIAIDVAKMVIISSDLSKIPEAIKLSKDTVNTLRQNLFWAFIYNIIGIPIAAGILYPINGFLLNPIIAGAAMAFSSVSVVLNSLRLKFKN